MRAVAEQDLTSQQPRVRRNRAGPSKPTLRPRRLQRRAAAPSIVADQCELSDTEAGFTNSPCVETVPVQRRPTEKRAPPQPASTMARVQQAAPRQQASFAGEALPVATHLTETAFAARDQLRQAQLQAQQERTADDLLRIIIDGQSRVQLLEQQLQHHSPLSRHTP